jgi:hypothetical protein
MQLCAVSAEFTQDRRLSVQRNTKGRSRNRCCSGTAVSYTSRVSVVLGTWHTAWALLSSLACPALQYFSTISKKRHDFRGKDIGHKICVFHVLQKLRLKYTSFQEKFSDILLEI